MFIIQAIIRQDNSAQLSILMRTGHDKYPSSWHPIIQSRGPQRQRLLCPSRNWSRIKVREYCDYSTPTVCLSPSLFLSMTLTTKCGLDRCVSPSLSLPGWPRSEVTADAVSTSWVSFRSSSSIHLLYRRKPRVSAEPWRQTCQTTS